MQAMRITVMFGLIFLMAFSLNLFAQEQNTEKGFTPNWGDFKPYEKVEVKASSPNLEWNLNSMLELGDLPPARFLTVDPMADMYPHMTPYHYALNNPMRFIDPTGMWVASYDSSGNIVNVTAEEGDNLEGLYSQLGITAEQFGEQYGISNMANYSVVAGQTAFNITNYVFANPNFNPASIGNANCASFVLNATGLLVPKPMSVNIAGETINFPAEESQVVDENFGNTLTTKYGYTATGNPSTGNVAVFTGNYNNNPNNSIHTALYVVTNQSGQSTYISRNGPGAPVSMATQAQYQSLYINATPSVPIKTTTFYRR